MIFFTLILLIFQTVFIYAVSVLNPKFSMHFKISAQVTVQISAQEKEQDREQKLVPELVPVPVVNLVPKLVPVPELVPESTSDLIPVSPQKITLESFYIKSLPQEEYCRTFARAMRKYIYFQHKSILKRSTDFEREQDLLLKCREAYRNNEYYLHIFYEVHVTFVFYSMIQQLIDYFISITGSKNQEDIKYVIENIKQDIFN